MVENLPNLGPVHDDVDTTRSSCQKDSVSFYSDGASPARSFARANAAVKRYDSHTLRSSKSDAKINPRSSCRMCG